MTKGGNGDAGLSELEQVMVALLYMNTTHSLDVIGQIFGIQSKNTVSKYLNKWIPELGELGDMLSSFLPFMYKDSFDALEPQSYIDMDFRQVAALEQCLHNTSGIQCDFSSYICLVDGGCDIICG